MTTTSAVPRTPRRAQVPWRQKVTFPLAELGSQFVWTTVGTYLLLFYTDVALIAPATAGTIMLVSRALDGIQDLGFGYIAERTHSRWGRFRPYVMFGAPFLTLSLVLAFVNPVSGSTAKVWWAAITYILLCFVYTVVNMSYGSMAGVMTTDSEERLTLNWLRAQGYTVASLLLNAVTMPLLLYFAGSAAGEKGYDARSFLLVAVLFGFVSLPMFVTTGANAKEVIELTPQQQNVPFSKTVKAVVTNRPLMALFFSFLLFLTGFFGRLGTLAYYVINNMGSPAKVAAVFLVFSVGSMIGQFAIPQLARVFGKARMVSISQVSSGAVLLVIFFVSPQNFTLILIMQFLFGLAGFAQPILLSMIPDAVDYYEDKTGIRADGTSMATVSLSTKIANAFGGAMGMYIMGWFGYNGAAQVQTAGALDGINLAVNLIPGIIMILAAVPLVFYRLDSRTVAEINVRLKSRRAAALQGGDVLSTTAD